MSFEVKFHGLACFSFHVGDLIVVFDPHDGKSLNLPVPQVRGADIVLCTHKHYDHNSGKDLVASKGAFILEEQAGTFERKNCKIIGTKVAHGGAEQWGSNVVYSIRLPKGEVFVHGGDIGNIPKTKLIESILSLGRPDISILPIGGEFTIDANQAIHFARQLETKIANIACHYLYGPLLTREDFQGMSTEEPFVKAIGGEERISFLDHSFKSDQQGVKKWIIFLPKLINSL